MADRGHELTEKMLADLEKRLHDEYTQAARELQKTLDDYMKRYRTKDKIWQKWVADGTKTQKEYDEWRIGQLAMGDRWEKMKNQIITDQMHTNEIARQIIQKQMPSVFSLNANYATYQVEHDARIDTSLTLYNRDAVNRILREEPDVLLPPGKNVSKKIRAGKAARWESHKLQSVMMQGIMQGDSIPKLASRLASEVEDSDYKAAVRNARTMSTNAQNAGRYDAYERLQKNGVDLTLEWAATLDNRTRHEHRMMHGQRRDVGEPFVVDGIEIMYPAQTGNFMGVSQSDIPQQMIWNCRCTILAFVKGFEHDTIKHSDKMGDMTFEEWLEAKAQPQDILHQKNRGDQFRDEYIREYAGMGTEKEKSEPEFEVVQGHDITETWERRQDKFDFEIDDVLDAQGFDGKPRIIDDEEEFRKAVKAANGGEGFVAHRAYSAPDQETLDAYRDQLYNGKWYVDCSNRAGAYGQGMYCTADYSGKVTEGMQKADAFYQGLNKQNTASYVEQFTLAPGARFAKYETLANEFLKYGMEVEEKNTEIRRVQAKNADKEYLKQILHKAGFGENEAAKKLLSGMVQVEKVGWEEMGSLYQKLSNEERTKLSELSNEFYSGMYDFRKGYIDKKIIPQIKDIGAYAASKGYDAIDVRGRGVHNTNECIILNRTKVIILRGK